MAADGAVEAAVDSADLSFTGLFCGIRRFLFDLCDI
jgi:hypothetical protein